jgi:hypothetical protein
MGGIVSVGGSGQDIFDANSLIIKGIENGASVEQLTNSFPQFRQCDDSITQTAINTFKNTCVDVVQSSVSVALMSTAQKLRITDAISQPQYGVSLRFLMKFIKDHNIPESMTTAEVVYNIIIPETADSKLSYVEGKLLKGGEKSPFVSDLRAGHRNERENDSYAPLAIYAFVSVSLVLRYCCLIPYNR